MTATLRLPILRLALLSTLSLGLAGCDHMTHAQQRVLSGGAIGAAGGAALAVVTGGAPIWGALIGAGGGAAIGAITAH